MRVWLLVPCLLSLCLAHSPSVSAPSFVDSLTSDPKSVSLAVVFALILLYQCFKSAPRSHVTVVFKKLDPASLQELSASVAKHVAEVRGPTAGPEDTLVGVNEAVSTLKQLQYEFQNEIIKAHEQIWKGLIQLQTAPDAVRPPPADPVLPVEPIRTGKDPTPPKEAVPVPVFPPTKTEEPKPAPVEAVPPPVVKPEEVTDVVPKPPSNPPSRRASEDVKPPKPDDPRPPKVADLPKRLVEEEAKLPPAPPAQAEEAKKPADTEEVKAPTPGKFVPPMRKPGVTRPKFVPPAVVSSPFGAK